MACTRREQRAPAGGLKRLRDLGNTVIVVEHDEEAIRSADRSWSGSRHQRPSAATSSAQRLGRRGHDAGGVPHRAISLRRARFADPMRGREHEPALPARGRSAPAATTSRT